MSASIEADVKEAIKRAGGCTNKFEAFLSPLSLATVVQNVNAKTGTKQRSISLIPRSSMPANLLKAIKVNP